MKVRGRLFGRTRTLRIVFATEGYTALERSLEYNEDVGCAGTALAQNAQVYFDATEAHETRKDMTAEQREATAHVQSILSTPIYRRQPNSHELSRPIGILNLDSSEPIAISGFRNDNLQDVAARYAAMIGALLQ